MFFKRWKPYLVIFGENYDETQKSFLEKIPRAKTGYRITLSPILKPENEKEKRKLAKEAALEG